MSQTLYCHVCGEALHEDGLGFSDYEYSCPVCQIAYRLSGEEAHYIGPRFVEHHEPPVVIPIAHLQDPHHIRHIAR